MSSRYYCCQDFRRAEIARRPDMNGIDFIEVLDEAGMLADERQRTLFVHFVNDPSGLPLGPANVAIQGGERDAFRNPQVTDARVVIDPRSGSPRAVLVVEVDHPGDYSIYTLQLSARDEDDPQNENWIDSLDPLMRAVDFSFKVNCRSQFDCKGKPSCTPPAWQEPPINYLARDFTTLRKLVLDRMAVLMPQWRERNAADAGIALVELLAYVGDYLSYRQDAVATEAYLETARRRVSVRRHARLVDYRMHDGCNARAWVQVTVSQTLTLPRGTTFLTAVPGLEPRLVPDSEAWRTALGSGAEVFASMHPATLFPAHNALEFYTWGARQCCLPKGSCQATLRGSLPDLKPGMVLIFKEVCNPRSGNSADADTRHRHAVLLTAVETARDPIGGRFDLPPVDTPVDVTRITWAREDRLPFALCISAEKDDAHGGGYVAPVSVALGNMVLVDHGRLIAGENLGVVPQPRLEQIPSPQVDTGSGETACTRRRLETVPPRFRPVLKEAGLTQAAPYHQDRPPASAHALMHWDMAAVLPSISLRSQLDDDPPRPWQPQKELLNSAGRSEFVVEVEADGRAFARFGDGDHGARPSPGEKFTADYRIGNGVRGNVGADSILHVVSDDAAIEKVSNPLPARGGREMESIGQVRAKAPQAFRTQQRAVTLDDYASLAGAHAGVQKASASLRWTGSWHTLFISVDRTGGAPLDDAFETDLRAFMEPRRLAGHDLEIDRPRMVPLAIDMTVEVHPDYERSRVRAELLLLFSRAEGPDGRRGLFHPDNFTFGQTVYLSPLYAAAQATEGVAGVEITRFERQDAPGSKGLDDGQLTLGRFEIARLDNDPNFPGRGTFTLNLRGGR
jgi:hypothetical protein